MGMPESVDAQQMWEQRYAESDRIWSGRPNARLVEAVTGLPPGTALDLGCGEGGDAVWLARQGGRVTAVGIATQPPRPPAGKRLPLPPPKSPPASPIW